MMVGRLLSYSEGNFLGAMLNSGRVPHWLSQVSLPEVNNGGIFVHFDRPNFLLHQLKQVIDHSLDA